MKDMAVLSITYIKGVIGDKRDKDAAKKAIEILLDKTKDMEFDLDKRYYVSEWSWSPICDGIFVFEEVIRDVKDFGTTKAYCTKTNNRTYFPWDLFDNKSDCQKMCDFKNSFAYDWQTATGDLLSSLHAGNEMGVWE